MRCAWVHLFVCINISTKRCCVGECVYMHTLLYVSLPRVFHFEFDDFMSLILYARSHSYEGNIGHSLQIVQADSSRLYTLSRTSNMTFLTLSLSLSFVGVFYQSDIQTAMRHLTETFWCFLLSFRVFHRIKQGQLGLHSSYLKFSFVKSIFPKQAEICCVF